MPRPLLALTLLVIPAAMAACTSSVTGQGGSGEGGSGEGGSGGGSAGGGGSGEGGSCPEGESLFYTSPGCGPDAHPVCAPPPLPCAEEYCTCNGEMTLGCGGTGQPYQSQGSC